MKKIITCLVALSGALVQAESAPFSDVIGKWSDKVDISVSHNPKSTNDAAWAGQAFAEIDGNGQFTLLTRNGCKMIGNLTPYLSSYKVNFTVSDCQEVQLNGLYPGYVSFMANKLLVHSVVPVPKVDGNDPSFKTRYFHGELSRL